MRSLSFLFAIVLLLEAGTLARAEVLPPVQVEIESRFLEVDDAFLKEIGIDFGLGFNQGFSDSTDLVPLRENNQPTGGTLFEFDSDSLDGTGRLGIDFVGPAFSFLGAPTVLRMGIGAEGTRLDSSDDKGDVMVPAGQQAYVVSLDGQQTNVINDPNDVRFEVKSGGFSIGPAVGLQSQISPDVQLLTSLQGDFVNWNQESSLWFMSGGNDFSDETEIDSRGGSLVLNISPVITLDERVDFSVTGTLGTLILDSELTRTRNDNGVITEAGDSRTLVGGILGLGAGVNVRPLRGNRSSVGVQGGLRYFSDIPILKTAFDTNQTSSIGSGDRSELIILVTARIVMFSDE